MEPTNKQPIENSEKLNKSNSDLPQVKVVADVVLEPPKDIAPRPVEQVITNEKKETVPTFSADVTREVPQKTDFSVLTAVNPDVVAAKDNSASVLLDAREGKPINKLFFLTPVLLLVVAGFAAAFYGGFLRIPFWNLTHEEVIDKMFDSLSNIRSTQYALDLSFQSEDRQPGAQGYDMGAILNNVGGGTANAGSSERDAVRLRAISEIEKALATHKKQTGKYPMLLNEIKMTNPDLILDPATKNQYGYRQETSGVDFTMHVQMETVQGIDNYRNAVFVIPSASLQIKEDKLAEVHAATPIIKVASVVPTSTAVSVAPFDPAVVLQNLPPEIDANLHFSGLARLDDVNSDAVFDANGKLSLNGMSFLAGVGVIKKGETVYGKIKEMPSFGIFDLSGVTNKWVKLDKTDLNNLGFGGAEKQLQQENQMKFAALIKTYLGILKEEKVLTVTKELPKTKTKDGTFYRYLVNFNNDKMATIYERLNAEIKKQFGVENDYTSADFIAYLRGSEYAKMNQLMQQNNQMELWVDTKNFWPRKFVSNSVFVPPESVQKLKDKQYRAQVTFELTGINKPATIEEPSDVISITEAEKLIKEK